MLKDEHRVRISQRCGKHPSGVIDSGGRQHFDSGDVCVPTLEDYVNVAPLIDVRPQVV